MTGNVPPVGDDEILLRHIPGGTTWQAPGPRITSINFRPRSVLGETSISVNRLALTTPQQFFILVGADPAKGSRLAWATAGEVRALGLRVEATPIHPSDLGHASIESTDAADLASRDAQRALALLFRFADTHPLPSAPPPPP